MLVASLFFHQLIRMCTCASPRLKMLGAFGYLIPKFVEPSWQLSSFIPRKSRPWNLVPVVAHLNKFFKPTGGNFTRTVFRGSCKELDPQAQKKRSTNLKCRVVLVVCWFFGDWLSSSLNNMLFYCGNSLIRNLIQKNGHGITLLVN